MVSPFAGKKIVVGVTGSIAAFKVAGWVSELSKEGALVSVVMTDAATKFVTSYSFGALSGNPVHTSMFEPEHPESMAHIDIGRDADLILVAPATANTLAKLANGIADNLLATAVLASRAAIVICPAMNTRMYNHPLTRQNIEKLRTIGYQVIDADEGIMACKEEGEGRLPEWTFVKEYLAKDLSSQDLAGHRILVTAGPTREPVDPARYLSNRSSGKMGYRLAQAAFRRGADVVLVSGPTALATPVGVDKVDVQTAQEMYDAVVKQAADCSIVIKAAAVADYRPECTNEHKVKKEAIDTNLSLTKNPDILLELGRVKKNQLLVGFAAESENLKQEGIRKLTKKNLDLIAVNNINSDNTGFEVDNNQVLLIDKEGENLLPHTSKAQTADLILDRVVELLQRNSSEK